MQQRRWNVEKFCSHSSPELGTATLSREAAIDISEPSIDVNIIPLKHPNTFTTYRR
jgi:hypothetical protein